MVTRPLGVKIVAALYGVAVAMYVALIALGLASPDRLRGVLQGLTPGGASGPAPLMKLGALLPVYFAVMAGISAALAWGMWTLRNWARLVTLLIVIASAVGIAMATVPALTHLDAAAAALTLLRVALVAWGVWYMPRPQVRAAFGR